VHEALSLIEDPTIRAADEGTIRMLRGNLMVRGSV